MNSLGPNSVVMNKQDVGALVTFLSHSWRWLLDEVLSLPSSPESEEEVDNSLAWSLTYP